MALALLENSGRLWQDLLFLLIAAGTCLSFQKTAERYFMYTFAFKWYCCWLYATFYAWDPKTRCLSKCVCTRCSCLSLYLSLFSPQVNSHPQRVSPGTIIIIYHANPKAPCIQPIRSHFYRAHRATKGTPVVLLAFINQLPCLPSYKKNEF